MQEVFKFISLNVFMLTLTFFFLWELIIFIVLQELLSVIILDNNKNSMSKQGEVSWQIASQTPSTTLFPYFSVIYSITIVTCIKFFTPASDKKPAFQVFGIHIFRKSLDQNLPLTPSLHCLSQETRCLCVCLNPALKFLKCLDYRKHKLNKYLLICICMY